MALLFGFSLFIGKPAQAGSGDGICETGENSTTHPNDCNGFCNVGDLGGDDCDSVCDEETTTVQADEKGSNDCDGKCEGNDAKCSADCDPLGQCAFEKGTDLTSADARTIVARLINIVLGLLGTVAVVIILIGGFKWMTAAGDDTKTGEARKLMAAGIIGMAIVLAAYSIASFVIKGLTQATEE